MPCLKAFSLFLAKTSKGERGKDKKEKGEGPGKER
jgi:hypothetical protein